MALFQTPPRGIKTRAQFKKELTSNDEVKDNLEVKSDVQFDRFKTGLVQSGLAKVQSEIILPSGQRLQQDGAAPKCTSSRTSSSSAARRKQLEFEAARDKALIELEEAQAQAQLASKKAQLEKELLEKKLAADLANLEECSRRSRLSSGASYKDKVENWLEKSVAAPGSSLSCNKNSGDNVNQRPIATEVAYINTHQAIAELSSAIKDAVGAAASNNNNKQLLSRLATSKDLPLYFGDPLEFLQLKEAYIESTRLCKYSDQENLWRLRKCLRGEAKEATSSLLMSAASPQEIIDTLELRFGRPENVMRRVVVQLKKLQPLSQAYHTEIVNFAIKVRNYVMATKNLKQTDYLRSPELVTIIVAKLPTTIINLWANHLSEKKDCDTPKLEILAEFLYSEAKKVAESGLSYTYASDSKRKPTDYTHKTTSNQTVLACTSVDSASTSHKCNFCKNLNHKLTDCNKFKKALRKDRWRFARTNKLCYKCLGARHAGEADVCTAESCDVDGCGGSHHRLLHWKKPEAAQATTGPQDVQRDTDDVVNHVVSAESSVVPVLSVVKNAPVLLKVVPVTIHGPKNSVDIFAVLDDGATVSLLSAEVAEQAGLHGKSYTMRATSAWDSAELVCTAELVDFDISNSVGERFKLRARKLKELNLPTQTICNLNCVETDKLPYLCSSNLNLSNIKATLLIGQDNYELIAPISCKKYMPDGPFISQTLLGWCVHGTLSKINKQRKCSTIDNNSSVNTVAHGWESPSQYAPAHCTPSSPFVQLHNQCTADLPIPIDTSTREPPQPQLAGNDIHAYIDTYNCACGSDSELHDLVRRSFLIDNLGVYNRPRQNVDEVRAVEIVDKSAKLCHNQWTVSLPWKDESLTMPDNYSYALKRLQSVERKMLLDSEYETRYRERVQHLFDNHYARKLSHSEINDKSIKRRWYLPHFGVDNPNKKKLRLVFDSSAKFNNVSLTTSLLRGPDLLNSLYGIMLRFRENSIGVLGDLKDMFLNIKIDKKDQHALRFLWKEKGSDVVEQYAMTSLIFGANCSPFIAQYINQNKNASRFKDQMPDSVFRIQTNTYMDDYIDSFSDKNIAAKSLGEISYIHKQGHFEMRNWLSNVPEVLSNVPKETVSDKVIRFDIDKQPERALGLLWHPGSDMLSFDLSFKRVPDDILSLKRIPTKREVLRIVMSIFDIHGYLVPFTIKGKILMREIWKTNLKWDSQLTNDLYDLFKRWISQANEINSIKIPRWYFSCHDNGENDILELHLFCDASPSAYAAVAYWRRMNSDGQVIVSFVASKSKVSSIKSSSVSVPRLELQAAVLACRLASSIEKEHRIRPTSIHYWTDSTTVLYWISNHSRSYKVFIANRLGEIDEYSKSSQWRYVPTDLNIADIGTKNTDYVLCSDSEWFTGPCFLRKHPSSWPQRPEIIKNVDDKILEKINFVNENLPDYSCVTSLPVPEPSRFSSWLKLLRATATVLLFIKKCRKRPTGGIDGELMHEAEILLLRYSQVQSFRAEINSLSSKQELKHDSRLRTLTPIIGKDNLLRVGSRIGNTKDVNEMTKYPVILDGKNHIARLIVMHYHIRAAHSCNEMVVNELRQKYWLVRLRPTVRSVAKQCLVCRFRKALPSPPRLADLPECRLTHHQRAFTMCGADLFGPIEVTIGRHRSRRYGVLFTCLTVRAVHIELVSSLTTDSMIMALRRMAARRGWPHTVFSDNGTNLRGADTELRRAYQEVLSAESTLATDALNRGVLWRFLSPLSPHKGGAWERLIRSVKTALKVVLKERAPREETLSTLLCEVENMINSRPITHVSVDPRDPEALTPNHLLIGSSSNLPRPGVFDDSDLYLRKQWRIAQRLADLFWSRWMKEVLPTLAPRPKWEREGLQFSVGDLVVVVDPASPRNVWPKGIVEKVYPGDDGRVRTLDIKTKSGIMKRPATRVALLLRNECRSHDTEGQDVDDTCK